MLYRVHAQAAGQHQHQDNEHAGDQLLPLFRQDFRDRVEGIVIGVDAEQAKDAHHPENTERHRAVRKKHRKIIGQEAQQIDNPREGAEITQQAFHLRWLRVDILRGKQAKDEIDQEKRRRHRLHRVQNRRMRSINFRKCTQHRRDQVDGDGPGDQEVIAAADRVIGRADLHHLGQSRAKLFNFCILFHIIDYICSRGESQ